MCGQRENRVLRHSTEKGLEQLQNLVDMAETGAWCPRQHIHLGPLKIYVRITVHAWEGQLYRTIDLATLDVAESERGKGHLTRWLTSIEDLARNHRRAVYIESVLNPRLAHFLTKRGYRLISGENSYYLSAGDNEASRDELPLCKE